jgi:hypothetical protein
LLLGIQRLALQPHKAQQALELALQDHFFALAIHIAHSSDALFLHLLTFFCEHALPEWFITAVLSHVPHMSSSASLQQRTLQLAWQYHLTDAIMPCFLQLFEQRDAQWTALAEQVAQLKDQLGQLKGQVGHSLSLGHGGLSSMSLPPPQHLNSNLYLTQ